MDKKLILAYIRAHEDEAKRLMRMYDYYRGRHDILLRRMDDPSKPNNRLCCGYPALIANAYAGYMHGEPVNYSAEDALMENVSHTMNYNDAQAEDAMLGLDLAICGVAVELHYTDEDGMERFRRVDPVNCVEVRDGTLEDKLTALIRYYDTVDVLTNLTTRHVDVYEPDVITYYVVDGADLVEKESEQHYYGDVPAVVYQNNTDRMGDFEGVITLIDAYDLMQSESLNDQEYFSDAYLVLKDLMGTTPEEIAEMKKNRVLLVPADADAGFLIKQQSDALTENIKTRLNNDIHRFSGCPDMTDQNFAGNASGVAIRYKLLQFENIAGVKEREFKRGLQRRLELLCNIWAVKNRGTFDWRNVQISFKRALPQNLLEIAQTLSELGGLLSDETKRAQLPIDFSEQLERERLKQQRQENMALYAVPSGYEELTPDGDE